MTQSKPQYFDLSHFALIEISGEDACQFLQGQIAGDLQLLDTQDWMFSGWCLPNGRVICTFMVFRKNQVLFLILPSMLKDKIIKRLSMFVLRSRVIIRDVSDDYALTGLAGTEVNAIIPATHLENTVVLKFSGGYPRSILISRMEHVSGILNAVTSLCLPGERSGWSLLDIEAGLPWIINATSESFLPQMLNLDEMQGLSYGKGCYPGQEVIARLHYRGQLKKRLYLGKGHAEILPGPGDKLEEGAGGTITGDVIDAERHPDGGFSLLAVNETTCADSTTLHIRGLQDVSIQLQPITYP